MGDRDGLLSEDPEDLDAVESTDDGAILLYEGHEEEALQDAIDAEEAETEAPEDFYENLAEQYDENKLKTVASDILESIEFDIESRQPWSGVIADGIANLGLTPDAVVEDFENACTATYPLVSQAMVQFNARTMDEIFPPKGPVKAVVVGNKTDEKRAQATRVADYMNYQVTEESLDWYSEDDQMTWWLGFEGSAFKCVYRDEVSGINTSRFVRATNFIVPYNATDLRTTSRFAERMENMDALQIRQQVDAGVYRDVELGEPVGMDISEVDAEIDDMEGSEAAIPEDDREYTIFKAHVYLQLEEDTKDLPYMVYVEKETQTILGIYRDWEEDDELHVREESYVHYKLVPGFGFYGLGYLHMLGNIGIAATESMRYLINAGYFASAQGGFASRDAFPDGVSVSIKPGVYEPTDATAEELSKAFFTPNFKDPSVALFQTLELLVQSGKEFASITEAMTGGAAPTGPVGTMVALIEQGSKVYSGIHKRVHQAKRREYSILFRLNGIYIPEDGYPYREDDDDANVYAADFNGRVGIFPVSDPNIISAQQRVAQANAALELEKQAPHLYDTKEVHRRVLEALRMPEIDGILIDTDTAVPTDQVTENVLMMMGKPTKVFEWQDHASHIAVLDAFMVSPQVMQVPPEIAEMLKPVFDAHKMEHLALMYRQQVADAMGGLPPVDMYAEDSEPGSTPLDPEMERQITAMAAQIVAQGQPQPLEPPKSAEQIEAETEQAEVQAEQERKDLEAMAGDERKQAEFERLEKRREAEHQNKLRRDEEVHDQELSKKAEENAVDIAHKRDQDDLDLKKRVRESVQAKLQKPKEENS